MENVSVVGIDIAKNILQVCVMSVTGRILVNKRLRRKEVFEYVMKLPKCLVALESCGGSSYWGRRFRDAGFEVRLIPAQHVKPFVKSQKNDATDAVAICEAALRPTMRFVSPNSLEQQDMQNLHRVRERLVRSRNGLCNQVRGLLLEYGITIPQGRRNVRLHLIEILESSEHKERFAWKQTFYRLYEELKELDERIKVRDQELLQLSRSIPMCKKLEELGGVGPVTSTAILAAVNNPRDFKNGRQFAAWLGLVPRQESSGGKTVLRGITKRGDKYIRKLLVHGARSELRLAMKRNNTWALKLKDKKGVNKTAVAMANKTARHIWAVLAEKTQQKVVVV